MINLSSKILHKIGMSELSPLWLKMWCLKKIFINIYRHIEQLPPEQRQKFDSLMSKQGRFGA